MAALDEHSTMDHDDYVDSFASLDDLNDIPTSDISQPPTTANSQVLPFQTTPIGVFIKSDSPQSANIVQQQPSTSSEPISNNNLGEGQNGNSFYYEKSDYKKQTPRFSKINNEDDDLMGEMIELDEVDLGSPPIKRDPFKASQLRMLDDNASPTIETHHDDKHKSVWSDLALQFLKGDLADDFLTFEDLESTSPEVLKLLSENKNTIERRKLLWRLTGGWLFSFLYGLGAFFVFILFGFCFSLPCVIQLWRIAKFLAYPYTKSESYFYLLYLLNTNNDNSQAGSRRMSISSSMTTQTTNLERKYSVTTVKEARQLLFSEKDNKGIILWIANIIWLCLFGWWIALLHLVLGGILLASVIGQDFGKRHLSLVKLALLPFGLSIK